MERKGKYEMINWKNRWKKLKKRNTAVLISCAVLSSAVLSVVTVPPKAEEVSANYLMDFAVSAFENSMMEGLGWAADKTGNQGVQDIYDMMSAATGGNGTDQIIKYCREIQDTLGVIQRDIGEADLHLTNQISQFANRASNLLMNEKYNAMQTVINQCDIMINAYNEYVAAAGEYAQAQNNGSTLEVIEQKKAAADQKSEALTKAFIRVGDDITSSDETGKIGTAKYESMLATLASKACTHSISYGENQSGPVLQNRDSTFTGLLYESYSLQNNVFDHQHRDAIETGMNASCSQFVKVIMAYRIQLDYVKAENDGLVEQNVIDQVEADSRMKIYEGKYQDYIHAVANAMNDIGTMYQNELSGLMHSYDKIVNNDKLLADENVSPGVKETKWYYEDNSQHPVRDVVETVSKDPWVSRKLDVTNDPDAFFRGNVNGVSYLISKKKVGMVPEDLLYTAVGNKDGGKYEYKLRSRYFYNFMSTLDGTYKMVRNAEDLKGLYEQVPAWGTNTGGFLNYLGENGQLANNEQPDDGFDENASYIVMSDLHKEKSSHNGYDVDGRGYLSYYELIRPHYEFYQSMDMIDPNFNYQAAVKQVAYNSRNNDTSSGVLLIMKETEGVKPVYSLNTTAVNAATWASVNQEQIQILNGGQASPGEQLKIQITPDEGWTLYSLKIFVDGEERDTLSGPQTFDYVKDDNGSFTFLYDMPYGNVTAEASFVVKQNGNLEGDGTEEHPYIISNTAEYLTAARMISRYALDAEAHYKVVNDIDFAGVSDTEQTEIDGAFSGVWDGGGYSFKNLGPSKYERTAPWLKTVLKEGTVKNLTFEDCRFTNLITTNQGTIDNCASTGAGQAGYQGMTYENTGKILNCYNMSPIIGEKTKRTGAITQNNNSGGIVANCFNRGDYLSLESGCEAGGLVINNTGEIYNCYNTGKPDRQDVTGFGALIYYEDSNEQDSTVGNSFYPDSLEGWSMLPLQHYQIGAMLEEKEMRLDEGLVKKLNEGLKKGRDAGLDLRYWTRSDEVNDGYPVFLELGNVHNISMESPYGKAVISLPDGTAADTNAPAGMKLDVTVTPDGGRTVKNITLLKATGEVLSGLCTPDGSEEVVQTQFTMPDEDCIVRVDYYEFKKEGNTYLIDSYPALLDVAVAVNGSDYFAKADYRLTADIKGMNQEWTAPIGMGREYTGTFDGGGYSIARLTFNKQDMKGGIFDTIGGQGTVKNLGVFGFTVNTNEAAGGLAAVNKGTIDNCWTGTAQLGEGSYIDADGEHSLSELNSSITSGAQAGGIAAVNQGTILNARSGADVTGGTYAGGIAGYTDSQSPGGIWNSYAMGTIGGSGTTGGISGAIVHGRIHNVYFAGTLKDGQIKGGITGETGGAEFENCYYSDGDGAATALPGTTPMSLNDMQSKAFADTLNAGVTQKGYDYWTENASQRSGYPYLTHNPYVEQTYEDPATGITVSGSIHAGALLHIKKLDSGDSDYKVLHRYVDGQKLKNVFDVTLTVQGKDEGRSPFKDSLTLSFPAASASDYWIVHYNGEELHVHKDVKQKDGKLTVQVETLKAFGIISREDADESSWDNHLKKVKTGDDSTYWFLITLAVVGTAVIAVTLCYRKRKIE